MCYATNDNQESTLKALATGADFALVVGGFNSSNTAQIAGILATKMPTYYISGAEDMMDENLIRHFDYASQKMLESKNWKSGKNPLSVVITSGASCPDTILEAVLLRLLELCDAERQPAEALESLNC